MQTGVTALRIATASHLGGRELAHITGQIVFDDPRIHTFTSAVNVEVQMTERISSVSAVGSGGGTLTSAVWYYYIMCALSGNWQSIISYNEPSAQANSTAQAFRVVCSAAKSATAYALYRRTAGGAYWGSSLVGSASTTSVNDT
jgi:hypothetical protein